MPCSAKIPGCVADASGLGGQCRSYLMFGISCSTKVGQEVESTRYNKNGFTCSLIASIGLLCIQHRTPSILHRSYTNTVPNQTPTHIEKPTFQYPTTVLPAAPLVPSPRLLSVAPVLLALARLPVVDTDPEAVASALALARVIPLELAAAVVLLLDVPEEFTLPPLPGIPNPICFLSKSNTA